MKGSTIERRLFGIREKYTPNQREYAKQVARIERMIKRQQSRGVITPTYDFTPPPRIYQRDLQKLREFDREELLRSSVYIDEIQDKAINAWEREQRKRREAAFKGWRTRRANAERESRRAVISEALKNLDEPDGMVISDITIFRNIMGIIEGYEAQQGWSEWVRVWHDRAHSRVTTIVMGEVERAGVTAVARRWEQKYSDVVRYLEGALYRESGQEVQSQIEGDVQAFAYITLGRALSVGEVLASYLDVETDGEAYL